MAESAVHRVFSPERCTQCGECFTRCMYMDLTREQAIQEIRRLIDGEPTSWVLDRCMSCYACNVFCPEDAHPYQLILEQWDRRYRERGLPARAAYMLPYHTPNYRTDLERAMSPRERELLARWRSTPLQGEVLYPGCNLLTLPALFDLPVFEDLPVSGDWSLCCGEPFYRMGLFEVMERVAAGLSEYYRDRPIEKMVFVCPACMNMFRNVLPGEFGADFDFECEYISQWLLRKMDAGGLEIVRPLDREVTIHDSCHGRVLGDEITESSRELLGRLGLRVINMKHHHADGICCGLAAGCNRQMPQDMVSVGRRELREGVATGAKEMAIYCTGCHLTLNMTRHLVRTGQERVHTLEYLAEATGNQRPRSVVPRTRQMLANIARKALPKLLSPTRYRIEELDIGSGGRGSS